jgi:hypothetical protein
MLMLMDLIQHWPVVLLGAGIAVLLEHWERC